MLLLPEILAQVPNGPELSGTPLTIAALLMVSSLAVNVMNLTKRNPSLDKELSQFVSREELQKGLEKIDQASKERRAESKAEVDALRRTYEAWNANITTQISQMNAVHNARHEALLEKMGLNLKTVLEALSKSHGSN